MTPQELRDIVRNNFIYILNNYKKIVQKKFYSRKKNERAINE